jgi:glycosidase
MHANQFTNLKAPSLRHSSFGFLSSSVIRHSSFLLVLTLLALSPPTACFAILANAWHIPDNASDVGVHMRDPEFTIGPATTVTIYSGVQKLNNPYGTANQTGGTLYYKGLSQGVWSSTNLQFYLNGGPSPNNQYWKASFNTASLGTNAIIQYYLYLTFDSGAENTYIYGTNSSSSTTASQGTAATSPFTFNVASAGDPVLTVNGLNADYTTTHLFVDEVAGDSIPLTILFTPNAANVVAAEVFSNLNRRDRATQDANGDGIEDGILPPNGNSIVAVDDTQYYKAYSMAPSGQAGQYVLTLNAQKTGAYRLTARYKVSGNTNWVWYSTNNRRDHALVVTPKKARELVLYELNTLNVESQGTLDSQRSTFVDLWDGPGSRPFDNVKAKFNFGYLQDLGINWLWFQPIHPQGIAGRQIDPDTGLPFEIGSPYAVKNFFEISPLMSKANTRAAAMIEFTNFVYAADVTGLNVMLDAPFNHTAYDSELAASGVFYWGGVGNPGNWQPTDEIRNREARFFSRTNAYDQRASGAGNIAVAPDRYDFGKFSDTYDVYFGRYAALVPNSSQSGNYLSEADWFDYSIGNENGSGDGNGHFDNITRNVWNYFADYVLYWLDKTGCPAGTPPDQTYQGIDGLRADFGQGLPPQAWEYIINKTRTRKWDFVFMTESLDGGVVTYRSNRHFDILNENMVFDLKSATQTASYRNLFESRRTSYGQGLVLLNSTSHDEENYDDPFQALIRYMVCGSIDGAPMIFYGQELGISRTFGFDRYELNFGKTIPQFKKYNSLQPILAPTNRTYGLDQLYPVYAAVGQARQFSRALRSSNRYFLDQAGAGGTQSNVFSVAKYEQANGAPNFYDVVFAFANLDRNNNQQGNFNLNITQNGSNLFGIKPARAYNVRNIAAYTGIDPDRRGYWLIPGNVYGSNLLNNGLFVLLKKVPTSDSVWGTDPFEAQYLKLYDVTAPPAPPAPGTPKPYAIGNSVTFSWPAVSDPEGGISGYHVLIGTTPGGSNVFNATVSGTTKKVTSTFGQTLYARVIAVNNAGIEGPASPTSSGTILLDPNGDFDGDGMTNYSEDIAGTNPLDSASVFRILSLSIGHLLTWSTITNKTYRVLAMTEVATNFIPISGVITATTATTSYLDPVTAAPRKFYRITVLP